jgi:hypothetical protein
MTGINCSREEYQQPGNLSSRRERGVDQNQGYPNTIREFVWPGPNRPDASEKSGR